MSWISRIVNACRPGRTADLLDEELQFHLEQRTADLVREGVARAEAEQRARRQLGNRLQLRESSQEVKGAVWLESLVRDFRFGLRMLRKYRMASLTAILSLGLAIGACTAAFALVDALIYRPLPVLAPEQLIDLARVLPAFFSPANQPHESNSFSYAQYQLLRESARGQADLFALTTGVRLALLDDSGGFLEHLHAEPISGEGFSILGIQPALGRLIQPDDDSAGNSRPVAVLSYAFWKRHYGGSVAALGGWLTFGRTRYQIIGVAASRFAGLQPGYRADVWLPLAAVSDPRNLVNPDAGGIQVWGRIHPSTNPAQLRERLQAVLTNFLRERARLNPPRGLRGAQLQQFTDAPLRLRDASSGADSLFRIQFRRPLWILSLICGLLLLIACSNVANLLLARASAREAEMALRVSLGASRFRLIRQVLMESVQVAAAACILGVGFATFAAPSLAGRLGSTEFPAWLDVAPDARSLLFAVSLSLLTALVFGLAPALRSSAVSPRTGLAASGMRGHVRALRWMLAAEIGFTVTVLFLSGLLLLSFRKLITVNLGFSPQNVVLFDLAPKNPEDHRRQTGADLLDSVRHLPGVQAASISRERPMGGDIVWIATPFIRLPGRPNETVRPVEVPVSRGFFETLQIRWIAGRDFQPEEIEGDSAAVIVNQAFVDKFFPRQDPIGQRFDKLSDDPEPVRQQIVGVVGNARFNNLREAEGPVIYTPLRDAALATLSIRTGSRTASLVPWLRKEAETASPRVSVRGSILLRDQIDNTLIRERLLALLAGFFATIALLLAGIGLYGVINYAAVRRTQEIGIRVALGARRGMVVGLILSDTATFVLAGVGLGIAAGVGMGRLLTSQLFEVRPTDFWSLAAPVAGILLVALAAVLPPAVRAASADPLIALRHE